MAYSYLADVRETQAVLRRHGLYTKHRLGQNFLVNDEVIGHILELAELADADSVLEVGPGVGTLTVAMLPRAGAVVAVEADRSLAPVLAETCADCSERLALVLGDALRVTPAQLGEALAGLGRDDVTPVPTKLVSNLPYQVAATVVLRTLAQMPSVGRAVVMVQREVADRMAALPSSRDYGAYTAKLNLLGRVTDRFEVGPGNFMPPPHVDSAVVRIDRAEYQDPASGLPLSQGQVAQVHAVVDAAFAQRRKTIRNSMAASGIPRETLDEALSACGIDPRTRAETLEVGQFVELAAALAAAGGLDDVSVARRGDAR